MAKFSGMINSQNFVDSDRICYCSDPFEFKPIYTDRKDKWVLVSKFENIHHSLVFLQFLEKKKALLCPWFHNVLIYSEVTGDVWKQQVCLYKVIHILI